MSFGQGIRREHALDQFLRCFQQQAGRRALRVALDDAAEGVGRDRANPGGLQGARVSTAMWPEIWERNTGGRASPGRGRRVWDGGVPQAYPDCNRRPNPFAPRLPPGALRHSLHDRGDDRRATHVYLGQTETKEQDMAVGVMETGHNRAAAQIGEARAGTGQFRHLPVGTHRDDPAIANRQRLGDRDGRIEGTDWPCPNT